MGNPQVVLTIELRKCSFPLTLTAGTSGGLSFGGAGKTRTSSPICGYGLHPSIPGAGLCLAEVPMEDSVQTNRALTIVENIAAGLEVDTGFITSAVVSFSSVDVEGLERVTVIYDGSLLMASKVAEYAAERLDNLIYDAVDADG
jgi:hypothetical protein